MERPKILIVEDEVIISDYLEETLLKLGYGIFGKAASGTKALELVENASPALVLMDIRLKGSIDGIETAHLIKEKWPVPLIFLTAFVDDKLVERASSVMPYGYLVKPVQSANLRANIELAIQMAAIREKQEKTENALYASELRYRTLLDSVPQRIFYKNTKSVYLTVNKQMANDFGLNPSEFPGKKDSDFFPKEIVERYKQQDKIILEMSEPINTVEEYSTKNGIKTVNSVKLPIRDKNGDVQGILGVLTDITDQIQSDKERKNLEKMLQQTQKMEAIGTLAGGIAHDFNNILHPVIGFSTLGIRATQEDEKIKHYFSAINIAANRAKELVKQILTFSRQNDPILKSVRLQPVIKETLKMLRSSLPTTISLETDIDEHCNPVKANTTQIHQILMNLGTNAYHAMQADGGTLSVSLRTTKEAPQNLPDGSPKSEFYNLLTVADTGSGIPADIIEKIFDPYFTTKDLHKGTGLGLSVVRGIVEAHQGYIEVRSDPSWGTEFTICFPATHKEEVDSLPKISLPELRGNEKILVVDDEENIVFFLSEALKKLDYKVTGRISSVAALNEFQENPVKFDLVVTDMTMPNMTGYNMALQMLEIRPDIPIIMCTGYSDSIDEEKIKSIGIRQLLFKPIDQDQLAAVIRQELDSDFQTGIKDNFGITSEPE